MDAHATESWNILRTMVEHELRHPGEQNDVNIRGAFYNFLQLKIGEGARGQLVADNLSSWLEEAARQSQDFDCFQAFVKKLIGWLNYAQRYRNRFPDTISKAAITAQAETVWSTMHGHRSPAQTAEQGCVAA